MVSRLFPNGFSIVTNLLITDHLSPVTRIFGVWGLGFVWDLGYGVWCFLEIIHLPVSCNYCFLAFFSCNRIPMLHPQNSIIPFGMNMLENIPVIDLTGSRFISSRIIPDLEVGGLIPCPINVGNDVSFGDLLMINIEKYLAGRTSYCLADFIGLG